MWNQEAQSHLIIMVDWSSQSLRMPSILLSGVTLWVLTWNTYPTLLCHSSVMIRMLWLKLKCKAYGWHCMSAGFFAVCISNGDFMRLFLFAATPCNWSLGGMNIAIRLLFLFLAFLLINNYTNKTYYFGQQHAYYLDYEVRWQVMLTFST